MNNIDYLRRHRRWLRRRGLWRFRMGAASGAVGTTSYIATFLSHGQY